MDNKFLKEWSVKLNVPVNELEKKFEEVKQEMKSLFPNQKEEDINAKSKLRLKIDYKRQFLSRAVSFFGVIIGNDEPRDPLFNIRNNQLDKYNKAKDRSEQTGDNSILQDVFDNGIVREEQGEIIPLWPKLKINGQPSKMAGQDMPTSDRSMTQNVYGVCSPVNEESVKGFTLRLDGDACGGDLKKGQITTFKAMNNSEDNSNIYELYSNRTEFLPTTNEYMEEGIKKLGITGLITNYLKDNMTTWEEINNWIEKKKSNPDSSPMPDKFNNIIVIPDALCVYQNFMPDNKNRIKVHLCSTSDSVDDANVLCLADKELEKSIDFAQNSKVMAIGRPWLPPPGDDGDIRLILFTSGLFAYPDWKFPRVEVKKMTEKELLMDDNKEKPKEETPVQKTPEVKEVVREVPKKKEVIMDEDPF